MPFQLGNRINVGKLHSEETKLKISLSRKGKHYPKLSIAKHLDRLGYKHSEETKQKIRLSNIGKKHPSIAGANHPHWKGGLSKIKRTERYSLMQTTEYTLWRKAVFERDNYTCIWCGAKNGNSKTITLHADHIQRWVDTPELRFAIDNGRTLCKECHYKRHYHEQTGTTVGVPEVKVIKKGFIIE